MFLRHAIDSSMRDKYPRIRQLLGPRVAQPSAPSAEAGAVMPIGERLLQHILRSARVSAQPIVADMPRSVAFFATSGWGF